MFVPSVPVAVGGPYEWVVVVVVWEVDVRWS